MHKKMTDTWAQIKKFGINNINRHPQRPVNFILPKIGYGME